MPTYEYQCHKCKKQFEYVQKISDAPKKKCEACGGKLERLISGGAFILKGGGWYKDLYSSAKPSSSSTETKTETKPAKTESKPDKKKDK
jgi:putative FmdB family regulatory protein